MRYLLPDGRLVMSDMSVIVGQEFIPPNTLRLFTAEDLAARGIAPVEDDQVPLPQVDLEALRYSLKRSVDEQAEEARRQYITPGESMAMTYQEKLAQARAYTTRLNDNGSYPLLDASVGIEGDDRGAVARLVIEKYTLWVGIAAMIEQIRLGAKAAIDAASDEESMRAAAITEWPKL